MPNMKPILFNTEMVRAILDGRKTTTRRVIKNCESINEHPTILKWGIDDTVSPSKKIFGVSATSENAPYQKGNVLYVRETFNSDWCDHTIYKADGGSAKAVGYSAEPKWHPSLHMPKEAARIFLRVTNVRVERLQEITEEQAVKEGCITFSDKTDDGKFDDVLEFDLTAKDAFIELWNSTLKKDSAYTWAHNPYVWVIEFERCEKP